MKRYAVVLALLLSICSVSLFAQDTSAPAVTPAPASTATPTTQPCIAVKSIGTHAARNVFLFGVAGALVSKQQYEVLETANYPTSVGAKYHGNDLQVIQQAGAKVVIVDKNYQPELSVSLCGKSEPTLKQAVATMSVVAQPVASPKLSPQAERDFTIFEQAPNHKAFAMSADGQHWGYIYNRASANEASDKAMGYCVAYAKKSPCRLIAVDDQRK